MVTIKTIVNKVNRNRMILFGIIGVYIGFLSVFFVSNIIRSRDWFMLFPTVIILTVTLVSWFFFFKAAQIRRDIKRNGDIRRLAEADFGAPDEICAKVDTELANSLHYSYKDKLFITQNWIISRTGLTVSIRPDKELIWAYKKITRSNVGGPYYRVVLAYSDGKAGEVRVDDEFEVEEILFVIYGKVEHVLIGYSKAYHKLYKNDISQFTDMGVQQAEQLRATMKTNRDASSASDPIDPLPFTPTQDVSIPSKKLSGFAKVWTLFWAVGNLAGAFAPASYLTSPQLGGIVAMVMLLSAVIAAGYYLLYNKKPVGLLMILIANLLGFLLNFIKVPGFSINVSTGLIMGIVTYFVTRKQIEYPFGIGRRE